MTDSTPNPFTRCSRLALTSTVALIVVSSVLWIVGAAMDAGHDPLGETIMIVAYVGMAMAAVANVTAFLTSLVGWRRSQREFPWIVAPISGSGIAAPGLFLLREMLRAWNILP